MVVLGRRFFALLLIPFLAILSSSVHAADNLRLHEQQIKAGLLYNFLKYTEWPASSFVQPGSITVCVFGDDPFYGSLKPMEGRTVNQREIAVRQVRVVRETEGCHLLFINAAEKKLWPALREFLSGKSVFTVSDAEGFTASGGMIELGRSGDHIGASLNIDAAAAVGLRVQDRLLNLVTVVRRNRS